MIGDGFEDEDPISVGCSFDGLLGCFSLLLGIDSSCSSVGSGRVVDIIDRLVEHEPVDRKKPLKKKFVDVRLSSRCLSNSKAHR